MPDPIIVNTPDDPRLADYRLLNDQAARRRLEGDEFFIAEGYVAIERLMESGHDLRSVLLAESRLARFEPQLEDLARRGVPVYVVSRSVLELAVGFNMHRGVLASAMRRASPSVGDIASTSRRIAVLEGLNDAENLGAISRAARALGIDALLIDPTCTDPYSRRTVRVSMGEVLLLPVARVASGEWPDALGVLHTHGFESWAMTPSADAENLWDVEIPPKLAVVLGAEGPGLEPRTVAAATRRVRIPIDRSVDSLNVGHASAITFAAIAR